MAVLSKGKKIKIRSDVDSEFLILAGPEIDEPVARYGPVAMNTREEINQAITDYQNGNFLNPRGRVNRTTVGLFSQGN